jgi:hypothetical protein
MPRDAPVTTATLPARNRESVESWLKTGTNRPFGGSRRIGGA